MPNRRHKWWPVTQLHPLQAANSGLRQQWAAERATRRTNCFHIAVVCRLPSLIAGFYSPLVHDGLLNGVTGKQAHNAGGLPLTCKCKEEWRLSLAKVPRCC